MLIDATYIIDPRFFLIFGIFGTWTQDASTYQKRDLVIPNIIIIKFQNEKTTFNNNILMDLEI